MKKLVVALLLLLCAAPIFGQQNNTIVVLGEASKKVQFNLQLAGFSLGYQGVAFPILFNKILLGTDYNVIKEVPVYTAIGITLVPIIPTDFHLETGFVFKGFTVDYSANFSTKEFWIEEEERRERQGSNGNLNLGFRHAFDKTLLWLKVGQGISGKAWGSDIDDGAFGAKGTHIEFRIIMLL